jgi:hypothetical protein
MEAEDRNLASVHTVYQWKSYRQTVLLSLLKPLPIIEADE